VTARILSVAASGVVALLALSACGGSGDGGTSGEGRTVDITLTDAGCDPARLELGSGPVTFQVENDGAEAISEFEILDGDRVLGEVENIAPGLSGHFSLTLEPGEFTMYCPGGKTAERGPLVVTGTGTKTSAEAAASVSRYRQYVEGQTALLVSTTRRFVQNLRAGDLEGAKASYAAARIPYERIEPVAESFGALDPAIDARAGDVPEDAWTGFHPIEQLLWVRATTDGTRDLASKLLTDVAELRERAETVELEPAQIANGAVELLGEVSKSKITGEEERYSHIDLVDFAANVEGAKAAFDSVADLVEAKQPALAKEIDRRFADVDSALQPYRRGAGYVSYETLTKQDTRALSRAIDALAEPLSQVGAIVAGQ
jgi:iron uptake system component EfeO